MHAEQAPFARQRSVRHHVRPALRIQDPAGGNSGNTPLFSSLITGALLVAADAAQNRPAVNLPGASLDPIDAQRLQLVADTVPALLAYVDEDVRYVWVNETYRRWFGRAPESIRGRHAPRDRGRGRLARGPHHVERALAGEEVSYEARIDFGPGHTRDVRASYVPDRDASGRVRGFVSRVTDITDVQSAERALRESEHMLAESQAAAHVGSWEAILNDDGLRARCAGPTRRIGSSGTSPAASPSTRACSSRRFIPTIARSCCAPRAPGSRRATTSKWSSASSVPTGPCARSTPGPPSSETPPVGATRLRGTCQDITERKRAETEMRLAREHLQVVVDATPALIARYDRGLRLVWANKNYAARFGKTPEELVGKHLREIVGEAAFAPIEPATVRVLAGETIDIEVEVPYPIAWAGAGCTSSSRPPWTPGEPWTAAWRSSPTTPTAGSWNANGPARSRS